VNRSILGRVFSILFLFYALAYGAFLVYSLAVFTADRALPAFQWQYAARQAFLLFVDYLIPVHVSGIVVAFSLGNRAGRTGPARNPQQSFARFVSSALAAFIFLTIVYTVLYEGLAPAQRGALADMEHQSTLARQFLELANANRKKGDFASALDYAEMYLRIDKTNQQVLQLDQELQSQASKKQLKEQPVTAPQPAVPQGLDATALLEKARYYYSQEDFFSAHYYATQASTLEPGRTDALRLAALAWDKITSVTPSQQEVEAAQLYQKKKEAYSTLMSGSPLTAYYAFTALASQYPKDNDIAEYLEESRRKVMESTFFIDEAERAALLPGTDNILFLNSDEKGPPEAVAIGKLVESGGEVYAQNVEALRYQIDGTVVYHFTARYGKLSGGMLLLHAIDRNNPRLQYMPIYSVGTRAKADQAVLALKPTVEELHALSIDRGAIPTLSLASLWRMKGTLADFGLMKQELSVQIVMDALMPFVFLTLSFLAVSFGWALRARYLARPPLALFIFVPLAPFVVSLLSLLWVFAHRIFLGFIVLAFGLGAALAACAILEMVVLVIALIMLAGQTAS
jgi:hypothetical protein